MNKVDDMDETDLPNDVVMDILTRLPLEQSGKARVLSKFFAKETHHSHYKELLAERQRGPILDGFLFQTIHGGCGYKFSFVSPRPQPFNLSLNFLPGRRPKILAAAPNGILLCETIHLNRPKYAQIYTICKPTTKQFKGIPLPRTRFFTTNIALFVIRSNPLRFKIVRVSANQRPKHPPIHAISVCEVFDSEIWRWKRLDDKSKNLQCHNSAVLACGSAHWKTSNDLSISAFDFYSESWSRFPMPEIVVAEYENTRKSYDADRILVTWRTEVVAYEGKLALACQFGDSVQLWVMENYTNKIWIKKSNLLLGSTLPAALYGSDISMTGLYDVIFSNLETGTSCKKLTVNNQGPPPMIFQFLSDFEPWNFHAPPRMLSDRTVAKIVRRRLLAMNSNAAVLVSLFYFLIGDYLVSLIFLFYFQAPYS